jgi:2-dehydro-3-deoxyphosphogluconate aldolase/(4S)-4-hydroxy-2-oxoglutarate aldolase
VGQACRDAGLALLPGVATAAKSCMAQEDGFTELKFFPRHAGRWPGHAEGLERPVF